MITNLFRNSFIIETNYKFTSLILNSIQLALFCWVQLPHISSAAWSNVRLIKDIYKISRDFLSRVYCNLRIIFILVLVFKYILNVINHAQSSNGQKPRCLWVLSSDIRCPWITRGRWIDLIHLREIKILAFLHDLMWPTTFWTTG